MIPPYQIKRSARRTLALEITKEAELLVRAPYGVPKHEIERFVFAHTAWIEKHTAQMRKKRDVLTSLSETDIQVLKARAKAILFPMTATYAEALGVTYGTLKITGAKTRFGSCARSGNICYSYRLMLYPPAAFDYVVVHELCHRLHFDHSPAFYAEIERILPDWRARRAMLHDGISKENI